MTRMLRAAVAVLVAVAGLLTVGTSAGRAGQVQDAIGTPVVTCTTFEGQPAFAFAVTFSHQPPALELRVFQYVGAGPVDSAHAWYRPPGTDTFTATFSAASESTFEVHLAKIDQRTKTFVDVVTPVTSAAYSC